MEEHHGSGQRIQSNKALHPWLPASRFLLGRFAPGRKRATGSRGWAWTFAGRPYTFTATRYTFTYTRIRMELDHEKLDVYRVALDFAAWAYAVCRGWEPSS